MTTIKFTIEQIKNDYENGLSCQIIGLKYGVSNRTIFNKLKKAGIQLRSNTAHLLTDKNPTKGKGHTEEAKAKIRAANKRQFSTVKARENHAALQRLVMMEGRNKKKATKPELLTIQALQTLNINYTHQFGIRNKLGQYIAIVDFLLDDNIIIEVQGDYWHCNPKFYPNGAKYASQKHTIANDKLKAIVLKSLGYSILYVWEDDLKKNALQTIRNILNIT